MAVKGAGTPVHVLVFQAHGLIVRMTAEEAWESETRDGTKMGGLTLNEMVSLAETFRPFE